MSMENEDFDVSDESGDRKYFTIVPNFVLNHSTMWDREVYIQMKRIAGDKGKCWTSRTTLARQCGMSVRRLDQCLKYLLEHEWIRKVGTRKIAAPKGGLQQVYEYQIVDLWKKNIAFYEEGGAGGALPKTKGVQEVHQGSAGGAHKEEPVLIRTPSASRVVETLEGSEDFVVSKKKPKYPHAREAFAWFPDYEAWWNMNTTQLKYGELTYVRGEKAVRSILTFLQKNSGLEDCPEVTTPYDLETKWKKIEKFAKRNGL